VRLRWLNGIDFAKLHEKILKGSAETGNNIATDKMQGKTHNLILTFLVVLVEILQSVAIRELQ
jgi:hypothetical protein